MSDPMTNMGADDVLASIRRLVSETYDPQLRQETPVETPERFVLSPDLRVIEGAAPQTSLAEDQDVDDTAVASQDDAPLVLEPENATHIPSIAPQDPSPDAGQAAEVISDTEHDAHQPDEALRSEEDDVSSESSEPKQDDGDAEDVAQTGSEAERVSSTVEDAVHAAQALMRDDTYNDTGNDTDEAEAQEAEWSAAYDDTPDALAADHVAGLSLEERIAELETAVEAQSSEWDAEAYDDDGDDAPQVFPQALVHSTARVLNFRNADFEKLADAAEIKAQVERQGSADAEAVQEEPGVEEAAGATQAVDQAAAVDDGPVVENTATLEHSEAEAHLERSAPDVPPLEVVLDELDEEDEDLALAGYADDEVLDEEALRDMIATVIREELQGALGERITSNVRRLVRREVQRALTLREFE